MTLDEWDGTPYCINGCGPATDEIPDGMIDDDLIVELVCVDCAWKARREH